MFVHYLNGKYQYQKTQMQLRKKYRLSSAHNTAIAKVTLLYYFIEKESDFHLHCNNVEGLWCHKHKWKTKISQKPLINTTSEITNCITQE